MTDEKLPRDVPYDPQVPEPMREEYVRSTFAATVVGVSRATITRHLRMGTLAGMKVTERTWFVKRLTEDDAPIEILQQDIFTFPDEYDGTFDYILEYICFCAIDPARRNEYADVVTRLLKPNGLFIDLAYPLDGRTNGPPFGFTDKELLGLFEKRGFKLLSREKPEDSISRRKGAEELFVFQKTS